MTDRIVIIGGGLAGATAAAELRENGYDGDLHLVAAEARPPYERPPLSKGYLLGNDELDVIYPKPEQWYADNDVQLTLGDAATRIGDHAVTLASGKELRWDKLLLATGAQARRLNAPGADADGIHTFRTVEDSEALKAALKAGKRRVVLVGSGWIGLELAAAAREYGNEVVVVSPDTVPLAAALGDELGTMFRELHEEHGVRFELQRGVRGFAVADGAVTGVETEDGATIAGDLVVVGIGAIPDTALAETGGIETGNGILTDERLHTSLADVFAAGDVANSYHPILKDRVRNEHWANALAGGKVAAAAMTGREGVLDDIPYFFTDQYDLGMEYSGFGPLAAKAEVVYRGDRAGREFIAFWVLDGRVVAGMNVNVWDVNEHIQRLIRQGKTVDPAHLADPERDLAEL